MKLYLRISLLVTFYVSQKKQSCVKLASFTRRLTSNQGSFLEVFSNFRLLKFLHFDKMLLHNFESKNNTP